MIGNIHSFESMGAVDGPGLRFVIFFQGCVLRCAYCHNPDSWDFNKGKKWTAEECVEMVKKYKSYFSNNGGVTVSGGEPLCQIDFLIELFRLLKEENIHTCLDTTGIMFDKTNPKIVSKFEELIKWTDLVLLDIKHIDNDQHIQLTGHPNTRPRDFAEFLTQNGIKMWIRYVLVPNINSDEITLKKTREYIDTLPTVEKVEVLPYHSMGESKYAQLGIEYRLKGTPSPTKSEIALAESILCSKQNKN